MMTTYIKLDKDQFATFMTSFKELVDEVSKIRSAAEKLVAPPDDPAVMASTTADLAASADSLTAAANLATP